MVIGFPHCTFKCEVYCDKKGLCQNSALAQAPDINVSVNDLVDRYINNPLSQAIVCAGLEPFDDFDDLLSLVQTARKYTQDDIVIYTGYNKIEVEKYVSTLSKFENIVIKFGRFFPNQEKHYDNVLGIYLASPNQYAERIS